jgi:hypothetical protein
MHRRGFRAVALMAVVFFVVLSGKPLIGQTTLPIANFDITGNTDGFQPALPPDFGRTTYIEHNQVNGIGNTSGAGALRVEAGRSSVENAGWAIRLDPTSGTGAFDAFAQVAEDESLWFLEFDVTLPAGEFGDPNIVDPGSQYQLNIGVNSDELLGDLGGFRQKGDLLGNLNFYNNDMGGLLNIRIPMTDLPLAAGSAFYQLSIGQSHDPLFDTSNGEGIDMYFDNFRFTQAPPTVATTLFSWETPDNPATTNIDERFEGWSDAGANPNDAGTTVHSIVSNNPPTSGAVTDGQFALQIQRTDIPDETPNYQGFRWGSVWGLSSDNGQGGTVPEIQQRIDEMKAAINGSSFIAFDLRIDDPDPNEPSWTRFGMAFSDGTNWFDAEGDDIGAPPVGTTGTYMIPTSVFDTGTLLYLDEEGLAPSNFLGMAISTNGNAPGRYQIDNLRVITEIVGLPGDFDGDDDVDGRDLLVWQRNPSIGNLADWQQNYGSQQTLIGLATSVPEPTMLVSVMLGMACLTFGRRNNPA